MVLGSRSKSGPADQLRQPRVDHGATDEKPLRSFRKRLLGRHGDRVRPYCCWYFGRDHRGRERPRHLAECQVPEHLDPAQVVEQSRVNTKAPADCRSLLLLLGTPEVNRR